MNILAMFFLLVGGAAWASDFSQEMDDKFGEFITIESIRTIKALFAKLASIQIQHLEPNI